MIYDVAILGGGAAGLFAARDLARYGRSCVVIEAGYALGGRMREVVDPRSNAPIELGAEFVHGAPSITHALLGEYGAARIAGEGRSFVRSDGGPLREDGDDAFDAANALLARADRSNETVAALLDRTAITPEQLDAARWMRSIVAGFDAADPERASAIAIADEWNGTAGFGGGQSRPVGGYAELTRHLARALPPSRVSIALRSRVTRIAHTNEGVVASVVRGAAISATSLVPPQRIEARAAIVSLPLGVLELDYDKGGVAFEPPLDGEKRRALAGLVMGPVLKVVLRFATAFWEEIADGRYDRAAFFHDPGGDFPAYWTQYPLRATTIVAWAGGPAAERLALACASPDGEGTNDALVRRALEGFGGLIGADAHAAFEAGYVHDWQRDPLFRGAYSYVAAGGETARAGLAAARPPLFFAGEATAGDGEGGTVAGALWSGERAAREAHAYLG